MIQQRVIDNINSKLSMQKGLLLFELCPSRDALTIEAYLLALEALEREGAVRFSKHTDRWHRCSPEPLRLHRSSTKPAEPTRPGSGRTVDRILASIESDGPATCPEIAERIGAEKSFVNTLVRKLVGQKRIRAVGRRKTPGRGINPKVFAIATPGARTGANP